MHEWVKSKMGLYFDGIRVIFAPSLIIYSICIHMHIKDDIPQTILYASVCLHYMLGFCCLVFGGNVKVARPDHTFHNTLEKRLRKNSERKVLRLYLHVTLLGFLSNFDIFFSRNESRHRHENVKKYDGIHLFGWERWNNIWFDFWFSLLYSHFYPYSKNNLSLSKGYTPVLANVQFMWTVELQEKGSTKPINIIWFAMFSEKGKCGTCTVFLWVCFRFFSHQTLMWLHTHKRGKRRWNMYGKQKQKVL